MTTVAQRTLPENLMWSHTAQYPKHPMEGCWTCDLIAQVEQLERQCSWALDIVEKAQGACHAELCNASGHAPFCDYLSTAFQEGKELS